MIRQSRKNNCLWGHRLKNILILNGSPNGKKANSAVWAKHLVGVLKSSDSKLKIDTVHLANTSFNSSLEKRILEASGVIFITGTYWDSWGSPLQKCLEDMTAIEASPALIGKPAAVFVLMHSVGGKGVLSRLQGVLSTFGFLIPPMCGMVYSLSVDLALKSKTSFAKDFWHKDDAELIIQNFLKACDLDIKWASWPVDKKNPRRKWIEPL